METCCRPTFLHCAKEQSELLQRTGSARIRLSFSRPCPGSDCLKFPPPRIRLNVLALNSLAVKINKNQVLIRYSLRL